MINDAKKNHEEAMRLSNSIQATQWMDEKQLYEHLGKTESYIEMTRDIKNDDTMCEDNDTICEWQNENLSLKFKNCAKSYEFFKRFLDPRVINRSKI